MICQYPKNLHSLRRNRCAFTHSDGPANRASLVLKDLQRLSEGKRPFLYGRAGSMRPRYQAIGRNARLHRNLLSTQPHPDLHFRPCARDGAGYGQNPTQRFQRAADAFSNNWCCLTISVSSIQAPWFIRRLPERHLAHIVLKQTLRSAKSVIHVCHRLYCQVELAYSAISTGVTFAQRVLASMLRARTAHHGFRFFVYVLVQPQSICSGLSPSSSDVQVPHTSAAPACRREEISTDFGSRRVIRQWE